MNTETGNKEYWKSINDYNNSEDLKVIKENEFLEGVTDEFDPDKLKGMSRRKFLAVLGASTAFAATACSDYRDKGEIVPYTKRPEEILPGVANFYASTCSGCSSACSTLIKTREGRPIKIDGNPDNPINKGKICSKGQAGILNLYDPERLQNPLKKGRKTPWNFVNDEIIAELQKINNEGKEIAIICNEITSPTFNRLLNDFIAAYPVSKIYSYKQFNNANRINAWEKCYGTRVVPTVKWNKAKIILALESDFLGQEGNHVENTRLFAKSRDVVNTGQMSRHYVAEGGMSLTGMNADYRFRIRPDYLYEFVLGLLNELVSKNGLSVSVPQNLQSEIENTNLKNIVAKLGLNEKTVESLLNDLTTNSADSILHVGDSVDESIHIVVNLINELLGNEKLFDYENAIVEQRVLTSLNEFGELKNRIYKNSVGGLVFINSDIVYQMSDSDLTEAFRKVSLKISLTESKNDTSAICDYVLPINNDLESWGDFQVRTGVYSLQQPVISPIFQTKQKETVLLNWINKDNSVTDSDYHKYLQNSFKELVYDKSNSVSEFKQYWLSAVHDGLVEVKSGSGKSRFSLADFTQVSKVHSEWTAHIQESYFVGEGSYANNGWLQEIPHPVTKVTWDNYAAVAPATAGELGLENGDLVTLQSGDKELEIPVMLQPGVAEKHLTIETGYGRTVIGDVGKDVGFNANKLGSGNFFVAINNVAKINKKHKIVSTQEHHSLDDLSVKDFHKLRNIIQEGTLEEYKKHPDFLKEHKHEIFSVTEDRKYEGHKWAMAIDLNKCISCAACVTSCNVENNIPVVGKDQVANGREMHWMRIDRYYSGTPEEPVPSSQPMLCQHCDNAPCENVCPVNATNHSPDGLNQMAYNRCVGTRYCANNCPYKVRRFNFFDFRDHFEDEYYNNDLTSLVNNPEVTVRSRGVMEKCTFCVQRIMDARSQAIKEGRELLTDEVKTACQTACPAEAIVFGDANDPNSKVAKLREHSLGYHVLEELNVRPNVTYIAKLRNTHLEES